MTVPPSFRDAALAYAARGWPVFHCARGAKMPLTPRGFKDATTDEATIRRWWRSWCHANVAIATGARSGLVILDVDPRNGGEESFAELEHRVGGLPETPIVHTGGGGLHFYFRHPGGDPIPCRSHLAGFAGIDLKGDGGYVIAPPSVHPSGRAYEFDAVLDLETPLAELPAALVAMACSGGKTERVAYQSEGWDGELPEAVLDALASESGLTLRRYRRDGAGLSDRTPSGVDASLASILALRGLDGAAIEAALRCSRREAGLPYRAARYYKATVGAALGFARRIQAERENETPEEAARRIRRGRAA